MTPIDDPNTPRFFSQKKDEIDEILNDIDQDLSDDVLDIESYDDIPPEPLKASKTGRFKPTKTTGDFLGKKSSTPLLLGSLAAVLVLGGVGAYLFLGQSSSVPSQISAPPLTPPQVAMDMPNADGTLPTVTTADPLTDGLPAAAPTDGLPDIDSPLPDVAANGVETLPPETLPDSAGSNPAATPALPAVTETGAVPTPASSPKTGESATEASKDSSNEPLKDSGVVTNDPANNKDKITTPEEAANVVEPETKTKADNETPVTKEASKTDVQTDISAKTETDKVTKPTQKAGKIKYFDAPPGEILEDIAPPSIDVTRNPGESIIIVQKPPGYDDYNVSGPDSSVRIERSAATETQAAASVSADRALRLGRYDMALTFYNQILAQNPNDVSALLGRAIAYQKMGRNDAAAQGYRDVLRLDKSNVTAATNLAGLQSGRAPDAALKNLSKVYQDDPNNPAVKAQMGVSLASSGDIEAAYDAFLKSTQSDPKNPQHFFNLAVMAERLGKKSEAIGAYEKCLEVDAIYGTGRGINRDQIYDRLTALRGQ